MISKCEWCGKEFDRRNAQRYCGPECKSAAMRKSKQKKKGNSVTDIAVAARAAGMTYGEYVARVLKPDSYRVHRRDTSNENKRK